MAKKGKRRAPIPKPGDKVRNRVSGRVHTVKRLSPLFGWFQLEDGGTGWTRWSYYTRVKEADGQKEEKE